MEAFIRVVRRLRVHQRVCWQRPRGERTLVFERAGEVIDLLERLEPDAREVEVHRAGTSRYIVYLRD